MIPSDGFSSPLLPPTLSVREMQVLASLISGKTNREIGKELHITESTVKSHLSLIFTKLDVSNRTEAAIVGLDIFPTLRAFAS
jgi:DNA-binding NarL/FixJ family response regulator